MSLFMLTERVDPSQVRRIDETVSSLRANVETVRALATKTKAAPTAPPAKKKKKFQTPEAKEAEAADEE
eukprot:scaffold130817_cov26-Attheya_sp.AAC.1